MSPNEVMTGTIIAFTSGCHGVALSTRGVEDRHFMVTYLTEDDGNWFVTEGGTSSHWVPSIVMLFQTAHDWLLKNADPDMHNGRQYGWRVREPIQREAATVKSALPLSPDQHSGG